MKSLVVNRKAKHEYILTDSFEAGMVLLGSEVKSLRTDGSANLSDAYVELRPDGAYLLGFYIAPYDHANRENHEPRRPRKLLLHQHELSKLRKATRERGMTIIPTHVYFKGSRVKVEIALAKGKKLHDKRQSIKERDIEKQLRRIR
ncbi:MAG: SsrA-binding protein SmpB [Alphaproteobacteria bacterium]|nr:SsrA-binding protein SmpB [Alphaproteobacteria bacterium]